jgi:hypothetical protein
MTRKREAVVVLNLAIVAALLVLPAGVPAGPYNEAGISSTNPAIIGWADGYTDLMRGPMDIANPGLGDVTFGSPGDALGAADCNYLHVVSLGDGGQITMIFNPPITNGPGVDFAVFENGFPSIGYLFAELAFVEVSTDGYTFARFPNVSLTPAPIEGYDVLDPTNVHNLAGKHPGGNIYPCQGTPFDLSDLTGNPLVKGGQVNLGQIRYVRVVDVIGDGSTYDDGSPVHPVYDPYPTALSQGGFDLQAIAVLNELDCPDSDGDGYSTAGGGCGSVDCNDADPLIYPGAPEDPGPPDRNCNGSDDCFIATAAFGTPFANKIDLLRAFRDAYLMNSSLGRRAVEHYYRNAEPWAKWIARHDTLRAITRVLLAPVIGLVWLLLGVP